MGDTVLLGIGCQKGGTSWLADYLNHHPQARLGIAKEMHVLDVHFLPEFANWHQHRMAENERLIVALSRSAVKDHARIETLKANNALHAQCLAMSGDLDTYVRSLRSELAKKASARLVCDITPSYAVLDEPHWRAVKALFDAHGVRLRTLFIMRDPVDRVYSAYRMAARGNERKASVLQATPMARLRRAAREGLQSMRARAAAAMNGNRPDPRHNRFLRFAMDETNLRRSRYDLTLAAIEAVFPPEDIHCVLFEELFEDVAMMGITEFLDIPFVPPAYSRRINASPVREAVPAAEAAYLRGVLDPAYGAGVARFGADRIRAIWPHA